MIWLKLYYGMDNLKHKIWNHEHKTTNLISFRIEIVSTRGYISEMRFVLRLSYRPCLLLLLEMLIASKFYEQSKKDVQSLNNCLIIL